MSTKYKVSKGTLHNYFIFYKNKYIFKKLLKEVVPVNKKSIIIDSTFITTPNLPTSRYNGKYKKKGTKLSALITKDKKVVDFKLSPGNVHDAKVFPEFKRIIKTIKPKYFYGDKAYDSKSISSFLKSIKCDDRISKRRSKKVYKTRIYIENFFTSLNQFREIERSFVRSVDNFIFYLEVALVLLYF